MDNRIIRVKGVGRASMAPDQIKINMNIKSSNSSYEEAVKAAKSSLSKLEEALAKEGFKHEDIKTQNFRVDTKYENETTAFNNYKRKFVGYEVDHSLKIEFENDSDKLSSLLNAIAKSKSDPEFSIIYNLKDEREMKSLILKNAVEDAREKALLISKAAGVELGEILNINYSLDEMELFQSPLSLKRSVGLMNETISIVPENLEASDTVDITWKIK